MFGVVSESLTERSGGDVRNRRSGTTGEISGGIRVRMVHTWKGNQIIESGGEIIIDEYESMLEANGRVKSRLTSIIITKNNNKNREGINAAENVSYTRTYEQGKGKRATRTVHLSKKNEKRARTIKRKRERERYRERRRERTREGEI